MLAVLIPFAFVVALPPSNETARYQLDGDLHLTPAIAHWAAGLDGSNVTRGEVDASAQLQMTLFLQRVHDDDAPPALQPFLQRVAQFRVAVGAHVGFSNIGDSDDPIAQRNDGGPIVHAAIDGYVGRYLYLAAGVGYQLQHRWTDEGSSENVHEPSVDVAIGARFGDVRIAAVGDWILVAGDEGDGGQMGDVGLRAHAVIRHHIELDGGAELRLWPSESRKLGMGGGGDLSATFWIARRLGLGIAGFYRQGFGSLYGIQTDTQAGGALSIQYWLSARTAVSFAYRMTWEPSPAEDSPETRIDLGFMLRLTFRPKS